MLTNPNTTFETASAHPPIPAAGSAPAPPAKQNSGSLIVPAPGRAIVFSLVPAQSACDRRLGVPPQLFPVPPAIAAIPGTNR